MKTEQIELDCFKAETNQPNIDGIELSESELELAYELGIEDYITNY